MAITFVIGQSGVGLSEHAFSYATQTQAAWVGNNAAAHISLLRATVIEELAFVLEQQGMPVDQMLPLVHQTLEQWGLRAQAEQDPATLSSGQTRRLAIASALLQRPESLVLDCPLDGLDTAAIAKVAESLQNFGGEVRIYDRGPNALMEIADAVYELQSDQELHAITPPTRRLPESTKRLLNDAVLIEAEECRVVRGSAQLPAISLQVPAGSITHIAGPNGVGKTSWFRACLGLDGYHGHLVVPQVRGYAPTNMDEAFLTRSVQEELTLVSSAQQAEAMLEFAGLEAYADTHPLDVPASYRRIVLVAVAMAQAPTAVFIDEPTVGLDAQGFAKLADLMSRFVAGEYHQLVSQKVDAALIHAQLRYPKANQEPKPAGLQEQGTKIAAPSVIWSCHDHEFARAISDVSIALG